MKKCIQLLISGLILSSCIQVNIGSSVTNVNTLDNISGDESIIEGTELDGNNMKQESTSDIKAK